MGARIVLRYWRYMALKDAFKELTTSPANNLCKFGVIYEGFDEETKEAFRGVLLSSATTQDITRALCADGIKIRREFVGEKRTCFTNPEKECCLRPQNPQN
jgi:RecB family endonuclease NucS